MTIRNLTTGFNGAFRTDDFEMASCGLVPPSIETQRAQAWLAGQVRIVEAWINGLIAEDGDVVLIATLDQHLAFLKQAQAALNPCDGFASAPAH